MSPPAEAWPVAPPPGHRGGAGPPSDSTSSAGSAAAASPPTSPDVAARAAATHAARGATSAPESPGGGGAARAGVVKGATWATVGSAAAAADPAEAGDDEGAAGAAAGDAAAAAPEQRAPRSPAAGGRAGAAAVAAAAVLAAAAAAGAGGDAEAGPPDSASLRASIDRMTHMLRLPWVRQYMLASTLATDVGVLTNPAGMQAAVVCHAVDDHQTAGSFGQRFLLVPAFGADGLSVGACVTQHSVRKHPLHMKQIFAADVRLGRWVRDDASGEWLVLTRSDVDNITRLMWIGSLKSTSRERITITCLSDVFDTGDIARSVLFQCVDTEYRPCPLCGSPPGVCGGCTLPVLRPAHPLDHLTSSANLMAVGGGHWSGQVKVTVYGQDGLRPMLPSTTPFAHRCKYNQDEQLALSLQGLAISERLQASPTPIPSPVSADMRELHQLALMYPDFLGLGGAGGAAGLSVPPSAFEQIPGMFLSAEDGAGLLPAAPAGLPALTGLPMPDLDLESHEIDVTGGGGGDPFGDHASMSGVTYAAAAPGGDALAATAAAATVYAAAVAGQGGGGGKQRQQQRLQLTEKERRAEERRVKNRIAAAKSNARAREALEKMRTDIQDNRASIVELTKRKEGLERENAALRREAAGRV